jgi:signal transduction histidine kinase
MRPDFQRLFEAAPALFMVLAPDPPRFTILAASDAYLQAVKKRRDEFIGRPVFEALPVSPEDPSSEANSRASFERVVETRAPDVMAVQRHDLKRPESEGGGFEVHYWSPANTPVLDESGQVVAIIHRVEDVTDYVRLKARGAEQQALAETLSTRAGEMEAEIYRRAQQIQEMNRQLRESNEKLHEFDRAKTEFFSNVSHEFRTPLTLLLGTLEELLARSDTSAAQEQLAVAHRNGLRLLKLVNSLLDFSRLQAGRATASYEPTDVGTLTAALAGSFRSLCDKAGLRLIVSCPPSQTPVYVDREMWEKVVLNLLSNAFKFTLAGEIEVNVRENSDACELSVRDTGVGIPEEELPRVFERFHRVESTRGRTIEGTGIGLSLVQEFVKLHGGSVKVESTLGRATRFTVRLPLGTAHLPADRIGAAPASASTALGARPFVEDAGRWFSVGESSAELVVPGAMAEPPPHERQVLPGTARPRVLLADDNADMRDYLSRLLAQRFDVEAAADGQEALQAARRRRPDMVLTDVMMPRLDGYGLLRALRSDPRLRTIPIIMLSARVGEEGIGEGLEAGADDYLIKPFSARELMARVTTNLKLAQMREEVDRAVGREEVLAEALHVREDFLAIASHELNTPLAALLMHIQSLQRATRADTAPPKLVERLEKAANAGLRLESLIKQLLDVSQITAGRLRLDPESFELGGLVREVIERFSEPAARTGCAISVHMQSQPRGTWDRLRIDQVLNNLIANAVKYGKGKPIDVYLSTEAGEVLIRVADRGIGIPPTEQKRIFERFERAVGTREFGGFGLGLWISRQIVEASGGRIEVDSKPGQGSTFTVRLPLSPGKDAHASQ